MLVWALGSFSMKWHFLGRVGAFTVGSLHVLFHNIHETLHVGLWWWSPSLLILSMPVTRVALEWAKPDLSISSKQSIIESPNLVDKMWFKRVKPIRDMELVLDSLPLPM